MPLKSRQRADCTNGQTGAVLLLIDLDNTLLDRSAAFLRWSARWAPEHGGDQDDVAWLIATDNDGYEPRERFAARIGERFGQLVVARLQLRLIVFDEVQERVVRWIEPSVTA